MSGVTGTMIGISVASSVAGAASKAKAAKSAAKTQDAAGRAAMASQQAGYEQQRKDFSPYQQAGAGAVGNLRQMAGQYSGHGQVPMSAPPPPMGDPQGPPPGGGTLSGLSQPPGQPPGGIFGRIGAQAQQGQGAAQQMMGAPPLPGQAPPMAAPALVKVKAPTGEIAMLPQDMADRAVQKGATVVP
jgi:hypothetical protein